MLQNRIITLTALAIGIAMAAPAYAQSTSSSGASAAGATAELRAAVLVYPPYVVMQNGSLSGFNIELWNAIAAQLNAKTSYQMMPDAGAVEKAAQSRKVDVVVAPFFITSARDKAFDFSIPTLEAGLQIIVRDTGETAQTADPLWDMLRLLFSRTTALWLGMALLLVLIPGHLVWLLERRHPQGIIEHQSYFPGIVEAIFWALATLATQAETMPRQWIARWFSAFWMFAGVVFVAFYTAQLTTTLTVAGIRGAIEGPSDLPGKQVATTAHSTAADFLQGINAQVHGFPAADDAIKALLDKQVDAVVLGAPAARYYATHDGKGLVRLAGSEFQSAPTAFMFPLDSPLRRQVDYASLKLRENGTYQQIYTKWFGSP